MGWLFTPGSTRRDQIEERTRNTTQLLSEPSCRYFCKHIFKLPEMAAAPFELLHNTYFLVRTCLKNCYRGGAGSGVLWTVWELKLVRASNNVVIATDRYIGCDILQYRKNDGWGYKDMCESVGPCYYSCPLSYLDMVPQADSEFAGPWREEVRSRAAAKKAHRDMMKGKWLTPGSELAELNEMDAKHPGWDKAPTF